MKHVTSVVTKGRHAYTEWVTKYKVHHDVDEVNWSPVTDSNANEVMMDHFIQHV